MCVCVGRFFDNCVSVNFLIYVYIYWTAGPLDFPADNVAPAGADGLVLKSGSDTAPAEGGVRGVLCMREVCCIHMPGW